MNRKQFLNAIICVRPGVASKDIIESMTFLYFSGEHVVSYNDAISIQYPLKTEFQGFIKADDIFKIVSKLNTEDLAFKMEGDILKMKSGKLLSSFATINDESIINRIAAVTESAHDEKFKTLPDNFIESAKLCSQAASKNESDLTLTCISIKGKDMVATDNVRIAHSVLSASMDEILLKASEIKALTAINPTKYVGTKSWIHFIGDSGCMFSIRRVRGEFPSMLKFMEFDGIELSLPKEILDGVDLASVFTDGSDEAINVAIKKGVCRIFKESGSGKIDFRESIEYKGQDVSFNIQPELLKEMMMYSTDIVVADTKAKLHSGGFTLVTSLFGE